MDQKLNALDLGISRFLEHNFVVVWRIKIDLEQFKTAAKALILQWPALGARLDFLVRMVPCGLAILLGLC